MRTQVSAVSPGAVAPARSPIDLLLSRLDRVKETKPGHFSAACPGPAHHRGDKTPSLAVTEGDDGRVLVKCFAGCSVEAIVTAVGLELSDLFPPRPIGHARPLDARHRPAISDRDLLAIVRREVCIIAIAGDDLTQGPLSSMELERLRLAVRRLFRVLTDGGRSHG